MFGVVAKLRRTLKLGPATTEPWMTDVLERLLPERPGLFVDVGVNLGQTLVKVRAIEPDRPYLGFEPNPACVAFTERRFPAYRIIPAALSTTSGVVLLETQQANPVATAGTIVKGLWPDITMRKPVVTLCLQDLPPELFAQAVGFLKIDVEGAELEVLQTLAPIIQRDRPIILIEILSCYSPENQARVSRQEQTEQLLKSNGYVLQRILKRNRRFVGFETITGSIGVHGDLSKCDYVARA